MTRSHSWVSIPRQVIDAVAPMVVLLCMVACKATPAITKPNDTQSTNSPTLAIHGVKGKVTYADGTPAAEADIVFTDIASGAQAAIVVADPIGEFLAPVPPGDYSLAVSARRGAIWVDKRTITAEGLTVTLNDDCEPVAGLILATPPAGTLVAFARLSFNTGDTFFTHPRSDGTFSLCLPAGEYIASLKGNMLSIDMNVKIPSNGPIELQGYAATEIRREPRFSETVPSHNLDGVVADIIRSGVRIVGLGEATHGSSEFVTMRAKLVFELAQRAELGLLLLENDAIATAALDRYICGESIDIANAVAELGFWITDTYEFRQFLEDIRSYNLSLSKISSRIRIQGIDVQNTKNPVELLLANTRDLRLSKEDQAVLQLLTVERGKAVRQFTSERRAALDSLLLRLAAPGGSSESHTRLAVAARSLAIQVGYMDGDTQSLYALRRDAGMAQIARFVVERTGARRVALWAHNDHVSRSIGGNVSMGERLAGMFPGEYYAVGFFFYEGSSRAWDAAGKVGVISYAIPAAPSFTLEGAIMSFTRGPEIAWLPVREIPSALHKWLETPRFARGLGAVHSGSERMMTVYELLRAFDAFVVIKKIHDSSPTPTGIRRVAK